MGRKSILQYRQRYDAELSNDILKVCVSKKATLLITYQDQVFYSRVLRFDLEDSNPYVVLDSLVPEKANALANQNKEVGVKFDFLHKGSIYHVRFHMILWGLGKEKGMQAVYSTPPLDLKLASESFTGKPTQNTPLWVKIPLFKEELRLDVKQIGIHGFVFEDRLIADTLPAVQKYDRAHLDFGDDLKIVVPGSFRGAGGKRVEFRFEKVPDEEHRVIERYLEKLFSEAGGSKSGREREEYSKRAKKSKAERFHILFFTDDDGYSKQLKNVCVNKDVELLATKEVESFYEKAIHHGWNVILVDGGVKDLDIWEFSRGLQDLFKEQGRTLPPSAILSDDLSEDYIVYAQYCGMQHVYNRSDFPESMFKNIAALTGQREWLGGGEQDEKKEKKTVVIIDDDQNVTFTLSHALSLDGFSPVVATNGGEGVRLAKLHRPSCIVLEIAVRSGDGIEALRMLKKMPFTRKAQLIVLTASRDDLDRQTAMQHGADVYLQKPVGTTDLVARIKDLC
jgi:DNA-binding response OmpR family regulator